MLRATIVDSLIPCVELCEAIRSMTDEQRRVYSMEVACRNCGVVVLGREAAGLYARENICRKCYQLRELDYDRYSSGPRANTVQFSIAMCHACLCCSEAGLSNLT